MVAGPIPNGGNGEAPKGRDRRGRFVKGNPGGPGNPHARKVAVLRGELLGAVSRTALRRVVKRMVALAEGGDVQAAKLLLDRLFGPPVPLDFEERLRVLESQFSTTEGKTP